MIHLTSNRHRFEILATCVLLSMVLIRCNHTEPVDFSEMCSSIKAEASAKLSKDAFDMQYLANKPWHVYTTFISNHQLRESLLHYVKSSDSSRINSWRGESFRIDGNTQGDVTAIGQIDSTFKAENGYYLVRILVPVFDSIQDEYVTCVWLKDHSWTSGFQILVLFKIRSGKALFLSADYLTISDVEEDR
jgi:hypothetical protein